MAGNNFPSISGEALMYEQPNNRWMRRPMQRPTSFVLIGAVLAVVGMFVNHALPELRAKWHAPERQRVLLYSADHQAIRDAGMALLESTKDQSAFPCTSKVWGGPPRFPTAPPSIRAIHPTEITLWFGESLDINCGATSRNYGVRVFLSQRHEFGTKQLLDRLWYYDSEGEIPDKF
jgi:hypothetical protein